jgi:hypothetical protein
MKAATPKVAKKKAPPVYDRIDAFIREFLADGPRPSKEIKDAAEREGFSENTFEKRLTLLTSSNQAKGHVGHMRKLKSVAPEPATPQHKPRSIWPYDFSHERLSYDEFIRLLSASSMGSDPAITRIENRFYDESDDEHESDDKVRREAFVEAFNMIWNEIGAVERSLPNHTSATDAFNEIEIRMRKLEREHNTSQY